MPGAPGDDQPTTGSLPLVMDIAHIAATPGGAVQRAEALLERLRGVIPFDAAFLTLLHPERREHLSLVRHGYDERTCAFLDGPSWMEDIERLGMQRKPVPVRACDFTVPPREVRSWAQYLVPAGFREGIGVGLFTADGRYLGVVGMHTESATPPSDAVRDLLGMLAPLIAHAVDPMQSIAAMARTVVDAVAGVVLTRAGGALPLPGLPTHPMLAAGSGVLHVAADELAHGGRHITFLGPAGREPGTARYLRVTVLPTPPDPPYHVAGLVTAAPAGDLRHLTPRELEVLGLLVEGWPNRAMAAGMGITERTVAAHIEHILAKLGVTSRTAAAVLAFRLGLFVPRLLHGGTAPDEDAEHSLDSAR
jgi:DNA-binding CsgD family transcriptional regulator